MDIPGGSIHLTPSGAGALRSIFCADRQDASQFTASFDYRALNVNSYSYGACFVIHNDPRGALAVANSADGYGFSGITNSVAISLEFASGGLSSTGLYTGGTVGGGAAPTNPLVIQSGHLINVTLTYNGSILHERLFDTVTSASFDRDYVVNVTGMVGSSTAYVGLAATNYINAYADQYFSNFRFGPVPSPAPILAAGFGMSAFTLRRRR